MTDRKLKSYEYKDSGGRHICQSHHMLRCSECSYIDVLEQENKIYRKALKFYADRNHYEVEYYGTSGSNIIAIDYGDIARQAQKDVENL